MITGKLKTRNLRQRRTYRYAMLVDIPRKAWANQSIKDRYFHTSEDARERVTFIICTGPRCVNRFFDQLTD